MAQTTQSPVAPFGAIVIFQVTSAVRFAIEFAVTSYQVAATRRILNGLSDEMLDDIGLTRHAIRKITL